MNGHVETRVPNEEKKFVAYLRQKLRTAQSLPLPTIFTLLPPPRTRRTRPHLTLPSSPRTSTFTAEISSKPYISYPRLFIGCWALRLLALLTFVAEAARREQQRRRRPLGLVPLPYGPVGIARLFRPSAGQKEIARVKELLDLLTQEPVRYGRLGSSEHRAVILLVKKDGRYWLNSAAFSPLSALEGLVPHGLLSSPLIAVPMAELRRQDRLAVDALLHLMSRHQYQRRRSKRPGLYAALRQLARQLIRWLSLRQARAYLLDKLGPLISTLKGDIAVFRL